MGKIRPFKDEYTFEERVKESADINAKFPDRVPMASMMGLQVSSALNLFAIVVVIALPVIHCSRMDNTVLQVGEELLKETLPPQMGSRLYHLQGLKPSSWYEVRISYPASIPAVFSLQLKKGESDVLTNHQRKLLNTEKLIFKTDSLDAITEQGGLFVLVNVEAEGVVAIPGVQDRDTILFNIVCDELLLGLPYQAWPVIILAVLCLALGFILPSFLPAYLLPRKSENQLPHELKHN